MKNGRLVRGEEWDGSDPFYSQAIDDLDDIYATTLGRDRLCDLQSSPFQYLILEASQLGGFNNDASHFSAAGLLGGGTIHYYIHGGKLDGVYFDNSTFALGHEIQHAWDLEFTYDFYDKTGQRTASNIKDVLKSEINAVNFENYLRASAGETDMREYYSGAPIFVGKNAAYFLSPLNQVVLRKNQSWYTPSFSNKSGTDNTSNNTQTRPIVIDSRTPKIH